MTRKSNKNNNPREMLARYAGKCADTGKTIAKGELCIYYPSSREIFAADSKTASDYYSAKFDAEMLGCEY